jgi:hypothetical protein
VGCKIVQVGVARVGRWGFSLFSLFCPFFVVVVFFPFLCSFFPVPYYLENKPAGLFNGEMWAARVRGWVR